MAALVAIPARVSADDGGVGEKIEVGGFIGVHLFSDTNELGVRDAPGADSLSDSVMVGLRLGYAVHDFVTLEGELGFIPAETRNSEVDTVTIAWRAHVLGHFTGPDQRLRPFAVLGAGALQTARAEKTVDKDVDAVLHAGLGAKYRIGERWGVRLDGRILLPPSTEDDSFTTDFEVLLGAYTHFGKTAAPVSAPAPARVDTDGDGLYDDEDECPDEAEDMDGFQDEDGCPDPDNDGDGIPDANDKCPDEAESMNGIDDTDGCPEVDTDGDGILGSRDACPDQPEDMDGFQDEDGCPDDDNDGDGVSDANDKCPTELETMNGYEDDDGCPDTVPKAVAKFTGTVKGINFKTGSAIILASSNSTLNKVAAVMNEFSTVRFEIQGHADDKGSHEDNLTLSQERAEAVVAYLTGKGIDAARLRAKGYGETQPIADNTTKKGKAENRRVDFVLISQ
ncbi:MAG TPA: OmpA family protein [Kofleriaceae bacterium]|nr:OmpA family protein [Kofleriaceae bacterium]